MPKTIRIRSIRRLTADGNHNAFTGAAWFKGALYVAFRQGDAHVCNQGRLVVLRSRDGGARFDTVHIARGEVDTRDAHLYVAGDRLYLVGFEADRSSGMAWTDNGLNWSPWTRYPDTKDWWLWKPQFFGGRHYCAAYGGFTAGSWAVAWFESDDGLHWQKRQTLREGKDQPSECYLDFKPNGSAALLMRRDGARTPLLLRAEPPYRDWKVTELDVPMTNPALWFVDDDIWITGRWFVQSAAHLGVFKLVNDRPELHLVLPSGPGWDCTYAGIARHPVNRHRFAISYYSGHTAPDDPTVEQWSHPDIYLADAVFDASFIERWKVSEVVPLERALSELSCPDPDRGGMRWTELGILGEEQHAYGFVDATQQVGGRAGVIYFVADIEVGPTDRAYLHVGFDGPVRFWVNGEPVFAGSGTNPAVVDAHSVPVTFRHGRNRIAAALDTNGGKACGIFARYEPRS